MSANSGQWRLQFWQDEVVESEGYYTQGTFLRRNLAKNPNFSTLVGAIPGRQDDPSILTNSAGSATLAQASGIPGTDGFSLELTPGPGSAPFSYAYMDVNGGGAESTLLQPGRIYRISADVTLLAPMVSGTQTHLLVDHGVGTVQALGPNSVGTTRLQITTPAITTGSRWFRVGVNSVNPADVTYWDRILVEDITDEVPGDDSYFDGDTPPTSTTVYEWDGIEHASSSSAYSAVFNSNVLTLGDGGENGCLPLPPSGLGVPGQSTQDVFTVQRDGVEMYRDTYGTRLVEFSLEFTNQDCPGGDLRQAVAQVLKQWNRNCSGATLIIFSDCLPDDFILPDDISPDPQERAVIGPYILHGRPRRAVVNHSRSNIGHSVIDLMFEADDQAIGVVQPNFIDGVPTEVQCIDVPVNGAAVPVLYTGDVEAYPVITLNGSLTDPIEFQTDGSANFTYSETVPALNTVIVDVRSGRALRSFGATSDATLLLADPLLNGPILHPDPFGNSLQFTLQSASGADTGYAEICYGTYVVGM